MTVAAPALAQSPESARVRQRRASSRASERWISLLFVVALLLTFFQSDVYERMSTRLLPLAVLPVLLTRRRRDVLTRVAPLWLVAFLLWAAASYMWSADPSGSKMVLLDLFSPAIVAWCCGSFLPLLALHRLTSLTAKVLCLLTVAVFVVAPGLATHPAVDGAPGLHGPFGHKNGLGAFLVLALVTFWFERNNRRRTGWLALGLVLLVASESSTALVIVLLAAAVLLWQRQLRVREQLWARVSLLGALVGVLVVTVLIMVTRFGLVAGLFGRSGSLSGRTNIWNVVVERIQEKPFAGWGFGGMWRPASLPSQAMWREMRFHAFEAHNGYLDILLQVGIVGLVLYLGFVFGVLRRHWRARSQPLHMWSILIVITFCLNAVTESSPLLSGGVLFLVAFAVVPRGTLADTALTSSSSFVPTTSRR